MKTFNDLRKSISKQSCMILCALSLVLPHEVSASDTVLNRVLSSLGKGIGVEAFVPCPLEAYSDAVCVVTDTVNVEGGTKFHKRALLIFDVKKDNPRKVFQYDQEEFSGLLSIRWLDTTSVMAIWATGSATAVTLFRLIDKEIKLVLEAGTEFSPEIVDLNGDGVMEVLISSGEWVVGKDGKRLYKPAKTSIYQFNGSKYLEVKAVPYANRLAAIHRETEKSQDHKLLESDNMNEQEAHCSNEDSAAESDLRYEPHELVHANHSLHIKLVFFLWIHARLQFCEDFADPPRKGKSYRFIA